MRFHHSTRRGRNRLGHSSQQQSLRWSRYSAHNTSTSRWSQLSYCRETNIHFNRRLPVEPPTSLATTIASSSSHSTTSSSSSTSPKQQQQQQQHLQHRSQQSSPNRTSNFLSERQQQNVSSISGGSLIKLSHKNSIRLKQIKTNTNQQPQDADLRLHELSIEENNRKELVMHDDNNKEEDGSMKKEQTKQRFGNNIRGDSAQYPSSHTMDSKIDMESARQKLISQVEKHRLWSNKAAKKMQLTSVQERSIYIYELISFCERRDLEWRYEPYRGGLVPSIPYRHIDHSTPLSSPISKTPPDLAKSPTTTKTSTVTTNELLAFDPIHKKTVLIEKSQSPDSFWSTISPNSNSSSRTPTKTNSIKTTTSGGSTTTTTTSKNSTTKTRSQLATACDNPHSIDRPIPSADFVWSIDVPTQMKPEPFYSQIHSTELPNSAFVKRCHGCQGKGKLKCNSCNGVGYEVCISCHGNGTTKSLSSSHGSSSGSRFKNSNYHSTSSSSSDNHHHYNSRNSTFANGYDTDQDHSGSYYSSSNSARTKGNEPGGITNSGGGISSFGSAWITESCHFCHGAGQKRCLMCAGKSYNHCAGCLGSGQLRCYLNLNITWFNHRDEVILNNSDNIIPKERLRICSGFMLVDEINEAILPLNCESIDGATGRVEETNQLHMASRKLLDKHIQTYRQERFIKQVSCCDCLCS